MEKKVRAEVEAYMREAKVGDGKVLDDEMDERGIKGPENRFFYAFMVYSNNFWTKLDHPASDQRMLEGSKHLDDPLDPSIRDSRQRALKEPDHYHQVPKSVMERRTTRQFFADVNRAAKESGVDAEKLAPVLEACRSDENSIKLGKMIYPVYVKLRQMGYPTRDLY